MALDSFENRKWKFTKHGMQLKGGETRVRRREPCKHEAVIARGYKGKTKRQGKASFECGGQKGEVIHYHTLLLVGGGESSPSTEKRNTENVVHLHNGVLLSY
jgi:hypothetical protein